MLGSCDKDYLCCADLIPFHLAFVDSTNQNLLDNTEAQRVLLYDKDGTPLDTRVIVSDNYYTVSFGLSREEMNKEYFFRIPSLNYQGSFVMIEKNLESPFLLFNNTKVTSQLSEVSRHLFVLKLPL